MAKAASEAVAQSGTALAAQSVEAPASKPCAPDPPAAGAGTPAALPPPAAAPEAAEPPAKPSVPPVTALAVIPKPKFATTSKAWPSVLSELGLKVTPRGIMLPESRRTTLLRMREQRRLGIVPLQDKKNMALAVKEGAEGGEGKKRKTKQRPNRKLGVTLDQEHSDLFHAAFVGDWDICRDLTSSSHVDVNVRTNADLDGVGTGSTAIHVAAVRGHEDVVAVLLQARADVTLRTGRGDTAIDLATRSGEVGVVKALRAAGGAPPDIENTMRLIDRAPAWDHQKRKQLHSALAPSPWMAVGAPPAKRREPMPSGEGRFDGEDAAKGAPKGAQKGVKRQRTKKGMEQKGGKGGKGGDWAKGSGKGDAKAGPEGGGGDWAKGSGGKGW